MFKTKRIFIVFTILTILLPQTALGFHSCELDKICVHTGDYAKYYVEFFGRNGTVNYNFGDFVDPDNIKVTSSTIAGGYAKNISGILNLKNNTLTLNDNSHTGFIYMTKVPIPENYTTNTMFSEQTTNFNGFNRIIYGSHLENGTFIFDFKMDKETGMILNDNSSNTVELYGKPHTFATVIKLLDTNIITSSNTQVTAEFSSVAGMIIVISIIGVVIISRRFRFNLL